jgi:septal ring factor EnvC (AmiA/AmiB activator)
MTRRRTPPNRVEVPVLVHASRFAVLALLSLSLLLVVAAAAGWSADSDADAPDQRLREVERALEAERQRQERLEGRAEALDADTRRMGESLVAAARALQDNEREVAGLETDLARLQIEEQAARQALGENRRRTTGVLMALQRLARHPPEAMIVQPVAPDDMVRSAILLRAAVPGIARRAESLRHGLGTLTRARDEMVERRRRLEFASAALREKRAHLDILIEKKHILLRTTAAAAHDASRRNRVLARQAKDLRDLLTRLGKERSDATPKSQSKAEAQVAAVAPRALAPDAPKSSTLPFSRARGKLLRPAVGRVVGTYGQATGGGLTRKGIAIETRPGAQVVAPYAGEIVFAGEFRGYGQLLIIKHGEGYHSLLAGLARLEGALGSRLLAGEPVGVMGRKSSRNPSLYLELRRNGQPINPLPWLAARKG